MNEDPDIVDIGTSDPAERRFINAGEAFAKYTLEDKTMIFLRLFTEAVHGKYSLVCHIDMWGNKCELSKLPLDCQKFIKDALNNLTSNPIIRLGLAETYFIWDPKGPINLIPKFPVRKKKC